MSDLFQTSMFYDVVFPSREQNDGFLTGSEFVLKKIIQYQLRPEQIIKDMPVVVFDFETTGLDPQEDRIIELGAVRLENGVAKTEFETLIKTDIPLTDTITSITGITQEMLANKPTMAEVFNQFLDFIEGAILVAHNAEFDMGFLKAEALRLGYELSWPCLCTLKMARLLLPDLEKRTLDSLAEYYGLQFESRHRSIGDVKVTCEVWKRLLSKIDDPCDWQSVKDLRVE